MRVIVRGSRTPCTDLPTGVERTVEWTPTVKRRIYVKGFYELVRFVDADENAAVSDAAPTPPDATLTPEDPPRGTFGSMPNAEPPAGNASAKTWLAFMWVRGIEVPVNDDGETPGRDGLISIWQQVSGGS